MDSYATTAEGLEPHRGNEALLEFLRSILPANDLARSITVVLCAFIVLVQAPAALLSGVLPIVREWRTQPRHAPLPLEPGPRVAKAETEEGEEIERLTQELGQTRERAERSGRRRELVEAYYSVSESGIFEERIAVGLARNRAGHSSVVAEINRAIAAGPPGVSSELKDFLRILERFAADRYAIRDLQDYHEVKARVREAMRRAIEAEIGR